jgi:uracil-DNA glycosylase
MDFNIESLYEGKEVYPPKEQVFRALELCPLEKTKVVIIGQDPYHGPGQANGLAFSVNKGVKLPPSLRNIYEELVSDLDVSYPKHGDLTQWAERGVLLLNTILTVEKGKPLSHAGLGWEYYTLNCINALFIKQINPIVFILWGINARKYKEYVRGEGYLILESSHPSPYSAHKGFFGSKPFSKANEFLKAYGADPVDWSIE